MNKLQQAIQETMRQLENDPRRAAKIICEGQRYREHICGGPIEMNEVLVNRRRIQKLSVEKKAYFFCAINCELVCQRFHQRWGHSRLHREQFEGFVRRLYTDEAVDEWIENAPMKLPALW